MKSWTLVGSVLLVFAIFTLALIARRAAFVRILAPALGTDAHVGARVTLALTALTLAFAAFLGFHLFLLMLFSLLSIEGSAV